MHHILQQDVPFANTHRRDLSNYGLGFDSRTQKYKIIRLYLWMIILAQSVTIWVMHV